LGVESPNQSGDVRGSPPRGETNLASIAGPASGVAQVDPATFEAIWASAHSHANPASSTRIQIPNVLWPDMGSAPLLGSHVAGVSNAPHLNPTTTAVPPARSVIGDGSTVMGQESVNAAKYISMTKFQ